MQGSRRLGEIKNKIDEAIWPVRYHGKGLLLVGPVGLAMPWGRELPIVVTASNYRPNSCLFTIPPCVHSLTTSCLTSNVQTRVCSLLFHSTRVIPPNSCSLFHPTRVSPFHPNLVSLFHPNRVCSSSQTCVNWTNSCSLACPDVVNGVHARSPFSFPPLLSQLAVPLQRLSNALTDGAVPFKPCSYKGLVLRCQNENPRQFPRSKYSTTQAIHPYQYSTYI